MRCGVDVDIRVPGNPTPRPIPPDEAKDAIAAVVRRRVGTFRTPDVARLVESELLAALRETAEAAMYWQPPDDVDVALAGPDVGAVVHAVAEAVSGSTGTSRWSAPVDLHDAHLTEFVLDGDDWPDPDTPPSLRHIDLRGWVDATLADEERFRRWRLAGSAVSGPWWSTPAFSGAIVTSGSRPGLGSLKLELEEDSAGADRATVRPVSIRPRVGVHEINGPGDWAELVARHPLEVSESRRWDWYQATGEQYRWFIPDWAAVATEFDGVHLSLAGYLTTAGVPIELESAGGATLLAGFDPDATLWLSPDAVIEVGAPERWQQQPGYLDGNDWHDARWTPV